MPDNFTISSNKVVRLNLDPGVRSLVDEKSQIVFEGPFSTSYSETYQAVYILTKRGFDVVFSIVMLILLLPLFALISILIKVSSSGPIIFRHRRIGQFGEEFDCLKFRTMVDDAEKLLKKDPHMRREFDEKFKIDKDPRVTRLGDFLRRSSLDELPQLINILRGNMTLIGPRPVIERELVRYSVHQGKLLSIKPGLSGLWQVSGRSRTTYEERVKLDLTYVEKRCFWMDIRIFFKTIITVLQGSGAR
ncbi:MAG: sugar transferase [Pyrinomonadaceae bacterium]|nr:sugar transferase [Pyrinomonadaceae bacterium]